MKSCLERNDRSKFLVKYAQTISCEIYYGLIGQKQQKFSANSSGKFLVGVRQAGKQATEL